MDMEVGTQKQQIADNVGPSEKQIESLLISFLNGLLAEQGHTPPPQQPKEQAGLLPAAIPSPVTPEATQ